MTRKPLFTKFRSRKLEWFLALYTLCFGLWLLLPACSMGESFASALAYMSETQWGQVYAVIGALHLIALHVNGRGAWTPFARLLAVLINSQVFLAIALNLIPYNPWSTGVFTYGFLSLGFCGVCIISAAADCGHEIKIWTTRHACQ